MWICTNRGFFSAVHKGCKPNELVVRARRPGDLEAVFPGCKVVKSTNTDYAFRAVLPRARVAEVISAEIMGIQYENFKNSVRDDDLHSAYNQFWNVHARLQPTAPYTGRPQRAS